MAGDVEEGRAAVNMPPDIRALLRFLHAMSAADVTPLQRRAAAEYLTRRFGEMDTAVAVGLVHAFEVLASRAAREQ